MSIEIMLLELLIVSTLTGLVTEALKKILDEYNKSYHANMLAGIVSVVLSLIAGVVYVAMTGGVLTVISVVYVVVLIILSWLCAMLGYDKVVQTITQLTGGEEE